MSFALGLKAETSPNRYLIRRAAGYVHVFALFCRKCFLVASYLDLGFSDCVYRSFPDAVSSILSIARGLGGLRR